MNTIEQEMAESATGCCANPHGLGQIYAGPINRKGHVTGGGDVLETVADMQDYLREGGVISIPNAGAGSYRKAFEEMGFSKCEVYEWSSSAGDWSFAVLDELWYPAWQQNRYPRHGFDYGVNFDVGFESKEECFDWMNTQ